MCGIFGCIKLKYKGNIELLTINALNILKNRGYDSVGVYLNNKQNDRRLLKIGIDGELIKKCKHKDIFILLEEYIKSLPINNNYQLSLGHTRWATHGIKDDANAHPHISNNKKIILVHNGIISNYSELAKTYLAGYKFYSSTDSEILTNLIEYFINIHGVIPALEKLNTILDGTWACIFQILSDDDKLYFMKNGNPLLISKNSDVIMITSEQSGFSGLGETYIDLVDKSYGFIDSNGLIQIENIKKSSIEYPIIKNNNELNLSNKYTTWIYKEIMEQGDLNVLDLDIISIPFPIKHKYLYIIGCGSSYYAGLISSYYYRKLSLFTIVQAFEASDFSIDNLSSIKNTAEDLLIIVISQSGETKDLVSIVENIKTFNSSIKIIGIINVVNSLLTRKIDYTLYTNVGRENSVASTKSNTAQIILLILLANYFKGSPVSIDRNKLSAGINNIFSQEEKIQTIARKILTYGNGSKSMFLLGKNEYHASMLEGALKIKEIAYIHAEGFNISSLKHGPYALIEKGTPIILAYKEYNHFVKSIISEISLRGAFVIHISPIENENGIQFNSDGDGSGDGSGDGEFSPVYVVIILQLLAYYLSILQDINPDRPRNLAKVVTTD